MDDAAAVRALDPEFVLARLRASRWALTRTLVAARIGIAAASLVLATRPGDGHGGSWWNVVAFGAYLGWALATGLRARPVIERVRCSPGWLWVEQALCVGLVVLGGGVRVISLYLCALPIIFATVFVSPRRGLALATADALVVTAVLGGYAVAGTSAGTEVVHGTEWPPALLGLFIAVGLFTYVRRLLVELERTGEAYRDRSEEMSAAIRAEGRAHARAAALADVAGGLEGTIPGLRRGVSRLRGRRPADSSWLAECDELGRLVDHAQESLDELTAYSGFAGTAVSRVSDIVTAAVARAGGLGANQIEVTACDTPIPAGVAGEALSRFLEEAVWNAHKHGLPPIRVTATNADGHVTVTVTDHGSGFPSAPVSTRLGLASLRRDAGLLGGHLHIHSEPDQPVHVRLTFPVAELG